MRIVIALGGNALLRRGEPLTAANQWHYVQKAAAHIAPLAVGNQLIITHGNGPQVGLLALQNSAYPPVFPLDVLTAQTAGMIGYLLEQALSNLLPATRPVVTLLTRVEVSEDDRAFSAPTKFIGPMYGRAEAEAVAKTQAWSVAPDGAGYRRVVASPAPQRILGVDTQLKLLEQGRIIIVGGGGGIPVLLDPVSLKYKGVEAVIDKDLTASLLARILAADCLLIATDVDAVYRDWGTVQQQAISAISVAELAQMSFASGSMGPKVKAACQFVAASQHFAVIGAMEQLPAMLVNQAGTRIVP